MVSRSRILLVQAQRHSRRGGRIPDLLCTRQPLKPRSEKQTFRKRDIRALFCTAASLLRDPRQTFVRLPCIRQSGVTKTNEPANARFLTKMYARRLQNSCNPSIGSVRQAVLFAHETQLANLNLFSVNCIAYSGIMQGFVPRAPPVNGPFT